MNIFDVRERLVADYRGFTSAFVSPRDERIRDFVDERLNAGAQWPDPWISLNPSFDEWLYTSVLPICTECTPCSARTRP